MSNQTNQNAADTSPNLLIRVKPQTRPKLQAIADAKRWKLNEAVDAAVDALMEREGIRLPRREKATA